MKIVAGVLGVIGTLVWLYLAKKASEAFDGTPAEIAFDLTWAILITFLTIMCLR